MHKLNKKLVEELGLFEIDPSDPKALEKSYLRCSGLLATYINKYDELEKKVDSNTDKLDELEDKVDDTADSVKELSNKIDTLTEATEGLVAAWNTANNVQKFIKWISSLGFLGMLITWVISKLPKEWLP